MNTILLGVLIGLGLIGGVASRFIFKKTDNQVEEYIEKVVKDKTNLDIDLSPDTPDPDSEEKK